MNTELTSFAARLRNQIASRPSVISDPEFSALSLELFALQFKHNAAYAALCAARGLMPGAVADWRQIPAVSTAAFKEVEVTCLAPAERTAVFHSSGTTEQRPGRHFHSAPSLAVYETSLWMGFENTLGANSKLNTPNLKLVCLTPPPEAAPHSSLVHMFESVRRNLGAEKSAFHGRVAACGSWLLDFEGVMQALRCGMEENTPALLLGTAFSFVHLLDHLAEKNLIFHLPAGSRVMETGGYKNRSRTMPKTELHALITQRLGVPPEFILCEYGMCELSSQAYDTSIHPPSPILHPRSFHFPPWARVQIISPESGCEVADGGVGLIRIHDLANVFSVAAIQTEDLGIRRGGGFELIGRAQQAAPRGCSLMTA